MQKKSGYPLFRHFWKMQCHCTMDCMRLQGLDGIFVGFLQKFLRGGKKPPLSGEVARRNAETERLQQICDDLSVTFGDSSPERGAKGCGAPRCLPL